MEFNVAVSIVAFARTRTWKSSERVFPFHFSSSLYQLSPILYLPRLHHHQSLSDEIRLSYRVRGKVPFNVVDSDVGRDSRIPDHETDGR